MPGLQETQVAVDDLVVTSDVDHEPKEAFKIRSYQLEMLEESMKRNIIVAVCRQVAFKSFLHAIAECI